MATELTLEHISGLRVAGYIGFSWTSLLFGFIPALWRGDWLGVCAYLLLAAIGSVFTWGFGVVALWIIWPFVYNRWHVRRLVEDGYQIKAVPDNTISVEQARTRVLGVRAV